MESEMTPPTNKVDMAQMNAAIDKVLALPASSKTKQKKRTQRKVEHPPPAISSKNAAQPAVR